MPKITNVTEPINITYKNNGYPNHTAKAVANLTSPPLTPLNKAIINKIPNTTVAVKSELITVPLYIEYIVPATNTGIVT